MNKLIRDFHRQAIQYTMENAGRKGQSSSDAMCANKFAELIVRECIDTVSDCSVEYCTRPQIVSEIKEHFGIKE
jgi:hypothetical protein